MHLDALPGSTWPLTSGLTLALKLGCPLLLPSHSSWSSVFVVARKVISTEMLNQAWDTEPSEMDNSTHLKETHNSPQAVQYGCSVSLK